MKINITRKTQPFKLYGGGAWSNPDYKQICYTYQGNYFKSLRLVI